jgi:hypothetical protein
MALAASLALELGAGAAVAAVRGWTARASRSPSSETIAVSQSAPPSQLESAPSSGEIVHAPAPTAGTPAESRPPAPKRQHQRAAELDLLQRAQAAFVGRDFAGALALLGEHVRRFPDGRLAEEREALRVRSLAGSGRADEARLAAAAFTDRFPRSVLVRHLDHSGRAAE